MWCLRESYRTLIAEKYFITPKNKSKVLSALLLVSYFASPMKKISSNWNSKIPKIRIVLGGSC